MRPRLLISVRDAGEADSAIVGGADLVDLKEPAAGALGAVDFRSAREIVAMIGGRRASSATVGDLPADATIIAEAAKRMSSSGVDFVKIGLRRSPEADVCAVIRELAPVARDTALIAVLFADALPAGDPIAAASAARFAGVMLDTANKQGGRLLDYVGVPQLRAFVASARAQGLICGLAGSLRHTDIAELAGLGPDYLGFRGAACIKNLRGAALDLAKVALLRTTLDDVPPSLTNVARNKRSVFRKSAPTEHHVHPTKSG